MALTLHENAARPILNITVSGNLTQADYKSLVPQTDRLCERVGKIRIIFDMQKFHGWQAGAICNGFRSESGRD